MMQVALKSADDVWNMMSIELGTWYWLTNSTDSNDEIIVVIVGMELGSMLDFTYELIQLLQQSRICKSSPFYRQEKLAAWWGKTVCLSCSILPEI